MKASVKDILTEIMKSTQTEIMARLVDFSAFAPPLISLNSSRDVDIEIRGPYESIQDAKLKCLVLLDKFQVFHTVF